MRMLVRILALTVSVTVSTQLVKCSDLLETDWERYVGEISPRQLVAPVTALFDRDAKQC